MAIFDRLDRAASRSFDRMFAVGATVDCMSRSPNGRSQPDPVRGEIELKGIFDEFDRDHSVENGSRDRAGNDLQSIVGGQQHVFSVDVTRYPAAREIRQGDRLTLDDSRKFEIISKRDDGHSRTALHLVAI